VDLKLIKGGKSMITVKMAKVENPTMRMALQKLASFNFPKFTTTIKLKHILQEFNEQAFKFQTERNEILMGLALKDEKGIPRVENQKYVLDEEGQKKAEELHNYYLNQEIKVEREPIKASELQNAPLSAEDLILLEGFIDEKG
jgi:hypothetical protein